MKHLPIILLACLFLGFSNGPASIVKENLEFNTPEKIKGFCFTAPPKPFPENPMPPLKAVNAEWIAVIPYAYTPNNSTEVYFNTERQWWGEKKVGIVETIRKAHADGISVMVKPQVWIPRGGWVGHMDFERDAEWREWEKNFEKYILAYVDIAEEEGAEMVCIGTELRIAVEKRPKFWRSLIEKARERYCGKLVYAANWDDFDKVPFWDELDYIGVNAYFPLTDHKTPTVATLKKAWEEPLRKIKNIQRKFDRPILFTEWGYLSVDGCAYKTWELEPKMRELAQNEQAQANAFHAVFDVFWDKPWWAGGFLWKWFPNPEYQMNLYDFSFSPQGKKSAEVIKNWYGKSN
ncbi:MAG: hypothetical protein AAF502_05710 [Bacteroidota bacterium]